MPTSAREHSCARERPCTPRAGLVCAAHAWGGRVRGRSRLTEGRERHKPRLVPLCEAPPHQEQLEGRVRARLHEACVMHEPCVDRGVQPRTADGEERHNEDNRLGHPRRREDGVPRRAHVLADVAAEVSKRHRLSAGKVRLDRLPLAQQEEAE